jgi:hypothetical protein
MVRAFCVPLRGMAVALLCLAFLALPAQPRAQTAAKIAPDLAAAIGGSFDALDVPWARVLDGELLVKVIVIADSDDSRLAALRQFVVSLGGSVFYNYTSFRALAVLIPGGACPTSQAVPTSSAFPRTVPSRAPRASCRSRPARPTRPSAAAPL